MKNSLFNLIICIFLSFFSTILYSQTFASPPTEEPIKKESSALQTYTWTPKISKDLITKVELKNGTIIKLRTACKLEDKDCEHNLYGSTNQIVGITADGLHEEVIMDYSSSLLNQENENFENVVTIEDYFGNKENAAFVIVSEHCKSEHKLCKRAHTYLLVPHKTFFRKYYVGVNVRNIKINLNEQNEIVNAQSVVETSTDKNSSKRYATCDFLQNLGFIDKRTKSKYIQFLRNNYREDVFDDKEIRNSLVKNMGLDKFRLLRKQTSWGWIHLALKRYLVVEGSPRYEWDEEGIMAIDTFTGNILWQITPWHPTKRKLIKLSGEALSGGVTKISNEVRDDFRFIAKYIGYHQNY